VAQRLIGIPKYFSVAEYRPWTNLPVKEIEQLGFKVAMYSMSMTLILTKAMKDFAEYLKENGNTKGIVHLMADYNKDYNERILNLKDYDKEEALLASRLKNRGGP
jgi:2-methylisocitrate lyase-like PEP mutase family enzyme